MGCGHEKKSCWQSLIISVHFCEFYIFWLHADLQNYCLCLSMIYIFGDINSFKNVNDVIDRLFILGIFKNVQGFNSSLYHHSWVSLQKFCVWLLCVGASRRSMAQATLTRVSASSGVHSGGRLNGSIHHRIKGNCASVGPHEQDRPIAQLLSQQCITGISQNKGKDRCEQGWINCGNFGLNQQTDRWTTVVTSEDTLA